MVNKSSQIEFEFRIGHCNGSMDLQILVNEIQVQNFSQIESEFLTFRQIIEWPSTMTIVVDGKNLLTDTVVDQDGKIFKDKFIELTAMKVDKIDLGFDLSKIIVLDTGHTKINSLYWGFNGKVRLCFDQRDSFLWHLCHKTKHEEAYVIRQTRF